MYLNSQSFTNATGELTSQEILDRLASIDINVSTQTLRNWEASALITPPARGSGYGGRWSKYPEYVLAECYAAHMLLHVLPKKLMDKSIPKFSIESLAKARFFCRFTPKGLPPRPIPKATYIPASSKPHIKIDIIDEHIVPQYQSWKSNPQMDLSEAYAKFATVNENDSFDTLLEFSTLLSAELTWFKYLSEGAKIFGFIE